MNNPSAFPQHGWSSNPETIERMREQGGMTLRDYFAAKAMQGLLANSNTEFRDVDGEFLPFVRVLKAGGGADYIEAWRVAGCTIDTFIGTKGAPK